MDTALVKFEAAKRALAEARNIDEVKLVRDQAEALRLYVRQQGESLEMQNDIAEIKLRAERRAGELLAEQGRRQGERDNIERFDAQTFQPPKLKDLGISKFQSHRWQAEAAVPEEVFEQYVTKTKAKGGELTSAGLYHIAKEEKRQKERATLAQAAEYIPSSDRWQIFHDNMASWIAPREYDFIITDPPYPREYLSLYEILARQATTWLQPGGLLVAMCGQSYLNEIMTTMIAYLDYYWIAAYLTPRQPTPLRQRQVNTTWKPLLIFTRKGDTYKGKIFGDVFVSASSEKSLHNWGQSVSGMSAIITQICLPGQWILDPFCGASSTGVAALMHNCLFHGVDIDENNVNISRKRLNAIKNT